MSLAAGTRLGPYEILSPIGAGGMSEVYRALDTRLGRDVAVKVLPAEFAADPERLRRFEHEARATAALDHPNILGIHDIGTHEGTPYIVEQLLEGESLRQRLQGGPLKPDKAVEFGLQIASGLAAAHDKGIVHRDLKPENLFITSDGRVKILDFGLARLRPEADTSPAQSQVATADGPTREGRILGTPGYMAPEQVRGHAADARSDIFAFGCVLFEMLTGDRAFGGESWPEILAAILKDAPSPFPGGVPLTLRAIVRRCLQKRPEDRYPSVRILALDLETAADPGFKGSSARLAWRDFRDGVLASRLAPAAMLTTALLLAMLYGWAAWHRSGTADAKASRIEPKRAVVAVFENRTGDPHFDPLGKIASEWISAGLAGLGCVEVVPTSFVFQLAGVPATRAPGKNPAMTLAEATGAGLVVTGSYYVQGQTLRIQSEITDAASRKLLYAVEPATAPCEQPMEAVEAVRKRVADVIAARELTPQDLLVEEARPPSYEAYKEFLAGEDYFGADYAAAIAHFKRALELDPDFVLPLGSILVGAYNAGDYAEAARQWELLEKRRSTLTPSQRRKHDFWRARLTGRQEEALKAARDVITLSVGDTNATFMLAEQLFFCDRPGETVQILDGPYHWDLFVTPGRPMGEAYFALLCSSLHLLGRHQRELEEALRGRAIYPDHFGLRRCQIDALVAMGRLDEAKAVVEETLVLAPGMGTPGDVLQDAAIELRSDGHREEALAMAARAVDWYKGRPGREGDTELVRRGLGTCLYQGERWEEAESVFRGLAKDHPEDIFYCGMLGALAARRGDRVEARGASERLRAVDRPYLFGGQTYQRARIAARLGQKEEAVRLLQVAVSEGLTTVPGVTFQGGYALALQRDMDFESLRGYPPFEALMRPKG